MKNINLKIVWRATVVLVVAALITSRLVGDHSAPPAPPQPPHAGATK
jgi:hypothetical protein